MVVCIAPNRTSTMAAVMGMMKNAAKAEVASRTLGPPHWQDGICSCTEDTGICCQTLFCAPCTASNIINKRDYGVGAFDCLSCICVLGAMYYTGNRFSGWLGIALRRELIQRYGIRDEAACNSCLLGLCCAPCVYCQVQREMGKRKEHAGGCCATPPTEQPSMADKALAMAGGALLNGPQVPRVWGSGLCDCTCMECLDGYFCPCMTFGYMNSRLDSERLPNVQSGVMDVSACCGSLWFLDGWTYANRREVIERYQIFGEGHIKSLAMTLCCPFCSILQQRREMGYSGEWPGGLCQKEAPLRKQ
jgi:Cys-rich protein (TIGR01571 family)